MKKILMLTIVPLTLLMGSTPFDPRPCKENYHCSQYETCVHGYCNFVLPPLPPSCNVDADCRYGYYCSRHDCFPGPNAGTCRDDNDCFATMGEYCNKGKCDSRVKGCFDDRDCPSGLNCVRGFCKG